MSGAGHELRGPRSNGFEPRVIELPRHDEFSFGRRGVEVLAISAAVLMLAVHLRPRAQDARARMVAAGRLRRRRVGGRFRLGPRSLDGRHLGPGNAPLDRPAGCFGRSACITSIPTTSRADGSSTSTAMSR